MQRKLYGRISETRIEIKATEEGKLEYYFPEIKQGVTRSNRQERVGASFYERNRPAFIRYQMVTIPCLTGCYGKKKNYRVVYKKQAESVQIKYILMRVPIENGSGNLPGITLNRALCRLLFLVKENM
jgi:hypothetical protein